MGVLQEAVDKKKVAIGGAAGAGVLGAAGGAYAKQRADAKAAAAEEEKKEILSRKGGVTSAQRETFADKQRMLKDERPTANKMVAELRRKVEDKAAEAKEVGSKVGRDLKTAGKEIADSPVVKGLKTAYNYWTKPGEEGQKKIQNQIGLLHKSWGKGGASREAVSDAFKAGVGKLKKFTARAQEAK